MKKINTRLLPLLAVWAVQLAAGLVVLHKIRTLDMLPGKYVALAWGLLLLLAGLTGVLMLLPGRKEGKGRRIAGAVIAILVAVGCLFGSSTLSKLSHTMNSITHGQNTGITATVGVYVLEEDPAQTLADAKDYTFAIQNITNFFMTQAVEKIEEELGSKIATENYDIIGNAVDALYNQDVQALILDQAYVSLLEDSEVYSNFFQRARLIYEVPVSRVRDDDGNGGSGGKDVNQHTDITDTPFILYLSGLDTRSRMLSTSRSDVNILAVVNPSTHQILLVNTPRDYYVANPAGGGALDKLTHCGVYGIECSMSALGSLYNTSVDYYAQINFTGFETLIDAIGGVTVYSDTSFNAGGVYPIQEGDNYLTGKAALAFARERHRLSGGDNDRGKNQMQVIRAVVQKLSSGAILTNYSSIMDSLAGMMLTDFSSENISKLVKMQLADMPRWNVQTYAVTGYGGSDYTYSMPGMALYVMYPNQDTVAHARDLIQRVLNGETLTASDVS